MENCKQQLSLLCNVCGLFAPKNPKHKYQRNFTTKCQTAFTNFFNRTPIVGKNYAPDCICKKCYNMLLGPEENLKLEKPMLWNAPDEDHKFCYACLTSPLSTFNWSTRTLANYPSDREITSKNAVWHGTSRERSPHPERHLLTPSPNRIEQISVTEMDFVEYVEADSSMVSYTTQSSGEIFSPPKTPKPSKPLSLFNQKDFDRYDLTWNVTEGIGSILKSKGLLEPSVKTTYLRDNTMFTEKFAEERYETANTDVYHIAYCHDIPGLFELYNYEHDPKEWRFLLGSEG